MRHRNFSLKPLFPLEQEGVLRKGVLMKDVHNVRKGLTVQDALRATSDLAHTQVTRDRDKPSESES